MVHRNICVDELANLIGVDFGAVRRSSRVWVKLVHMVHKIICVACVGFAVVVVWVTFVHIVYNLICVECLTCVGFTVVVVWVRVKSVHRVHSFICVGLVRPYPSDRDYA